MVSMPRACASVLAVVTPILMPVNEPGPLEAASAVTSLN